MSQSAPVVAYPITRSRWLAGLLLLVSAAGLGVVIAWLLLGAPKGIAAPAVAVGLWLLCSALAARFWWQSPQGVLAWDGYCWNWTRRSGTAPLPGSAQLQLDWQHSLWVRWQGQAETETETDKKATASPVSWFWLEQRHAPAQWADLRRALHAPTAPAVAPDATPPSPPPQPPDPALIP